MPTSDFFAPSYASARNKFLAAAQAAGARLSSYPLPNQRGPGRETLSIDVALLGAEQPVDSVLLLISGTHGVEGHCGSGIQVGYFRDQLHDALPAGTATLMIHALNPYGFAWRRRVNEDNIDLNRNFRDFSAPLPDGSAYEAIHNCLVPEAWDGPLRQEADRELLRRIEAAGIPSYQAVLQRGQYTRPTGLFYGGKGPCWSNTMLRRLLREHIPAGATRLAVLDIHTGLGPCGYGEPIYADDSPKGFKRARRWYGPELTRITGYTVESPTGKGVRPEGVRPESRQSGGGLSSSAAVSGALVAAFDDLDPSLEVTYLTLEFGTRPILEVLGALRADSWLHACPDRATPSAARFSSRCRRPSTWTHRAGRPRCTEGPPISF